MFAVASEIFKFMDRVRARRAEGFAPIADRQEERQAILDFARYFVDELFENAFAGDRARLAGRQLNLIRDTCEFLYRLEQDKENQELAAQGKVIADDDDAADVAENE
jgi:CRISPR-associated protein Csc3